MPSLIGNKPNQVPTNGDLGSMAFADDDNYYTKADTYSKAETDALLVTAVPAGTVIHVAMNTAPAGYLKANGALVSRTTFATLFAAIGTTFGAGDGSTTFALPDLRGEFLRGWDDGRAVDSGRGIGTAQGDAFGSHSHSGSTTTQAATATRVAQTRPGRTRTRITGTHWGG